MEASSNLREQRRGGLLREKEVLSSEGATERMTGQTNMTDVHSQGSGSKGNKSRGVGNTVRRFGREGPNVQAEERAELEALGREGGSCRPWRLEAGCIRQGWLWVILREPF